MVDVGESQVDGDAEASRPAAGTLQHLFGEVDATEAHAIGVVAQILGGADPDFQHPALGPGEEATTTATSSHPFHWGAVDVVERRHAVVAPCHVCLVLVLILGRGIDSMAWFAAEQR